MLSTSSLTNKQTSILNLCICNFWTKNKNLLGDLLSKFNQIHAEDKQAKNKQEPL